jgi:hypothetical protein
MRLDVVREMPPGGIDQAWTFYQGTFGHLRARAALRQVLYRDEFDTLMRHPGTDKYVCAQDDTVLGLAAMTNDLDAVPMISPEYFAHRWPDLYAERRIFYVEFVAARPGTAGAGAYVALIRRILERVTASRGIAVADVCAHNENEHRMPELFGLAARRVTGEVRQQRLDSQTFWSYEFPAGMRSTPAAG